MPRSTLGPTLDAELDAEEAELLASQLARILGRPPTEKELANAKTKVQAELREFDAGSAAGSGRVERTSHYTPGLAGLVGLARGLEDGWPAVEHRANQVIAMLAMKPRQRTKPAVLLVQLLAYVTMFRDSTLEPAPVDLPKLLLRSLAAVLRVEKHGARAAAFVGELRNADIAKQLGISERSVRRRRSTHSVEPDEPPLVIADRWLAWAGKGRPPGAAEGLYDIASSEVASGTYFSADLLLALAEVLGVARRNAGLTQAATEVLHDGLRSPKKFIAAGRIEGRLMIEHERKLRGGGAAGRLVDVEIQQGWDNMPFDGWPSVGHRAGQLLERLETKPQYGQTTSLSLIRLLRHTTDLRNAKSEPAPRGVLLILCNALNATLGGGRPGASDLAADQQSRVAALRNSVAVEVREGSYFSKGLVLALAEYLGVDRPDPKPSINGVATEANVPHASVRQWREKQSPHFESYEANRLADAVLATFHGRFKGRK